MDGKQSTFLRSEWGKIELFGVLSQHFMYICTNYQWISHTSPHLLSKNSLFYFSPIMIDRSANWKHFNAILSLSFFPTLNRPTFKTATLNSRTQLKQQLQREQLQELERQELERRENERKLSSLPSSAGCSSVDHNAQMAHSSHATNAGHQLQVPRNCGSIIPQLYASSPTPSTSTEGSDFASGHFSNPSNPMQHSDHSNAPLKVPLHIGVDLPPQVLKASTHQRIHLTRKTF